MRSTKRPETKSKKLTAEGIIEHFAVIPDHRVDRTRIHSLETILVIALCAVICGADGFVAIEQFGLARRDWLKNFVDVSNGIPSHDTFGRVFAALNPKALQHAFQKWVAAVVELTEGEVVAIDGKCLRRSFRNAGSKAFVHMVSAWATGNHVVLGQVKTDEKSNEITAIPRLLEILEIKGCLVTIDAMGCQKKIAQKILDGSADYLIAVKDNQPTLHAALQETFENARQDPEALAAMDYHETTDRGHGRTEVRRCWTTQDLGRVSHPEQWPGLSCLVLVESERTVGGKTTLEQHHLIASTVLTARRASSAKRLHWGIENKLHWVLDVAFREDDSRVREGYASENLAVLRHISLNLLRGVTGIKVGIKIKRMRAALNSEFLEKVLCGKA